MFTPLFKTLQCNLAPVMKRMTSFRPYLARMCAFAEIFSFSLDVD